MGRASGGREPGSDTEVGAVAEALHALGGDPVALLLGRLGERRGELVAALDGEALQAEVVVVDPGGEEASHLLVFGPDGSVGRLRPDGTLAAGFRAHLTLRGAGTDILALVLGELDVARAVYRGLLDLHVPPDELAPRFPGLMRVLATALLDLAHQGSGRAGPGRP